MKTPIPPRPRKKLGQNFLCDKSILEKIVAFIAPQMGDVMVEIGAGTGALTSRLSPLVTKLFAVELDRDLFGYLQGLTNTEVIPADIRKVQLCKLADGSKIRVVGNLPYYISTNILKLLLSQRNCILDMTLMFQEEVAYRITAPPGDREYGYLSVIAQYFCSIRKGFKINKNCFIPRPEVESRILRFDFPADKKIEFGRFSSFVEKAFSQRRKKLRNNLIRNLNLSPESLDRIFNELRLPLDIRAESLYPQQYEQLILCLQE
jgi:16S rRNA (adenine1518-N6/adenine1519-N6)-dimethyltransferase